MNEYYSRRSFMDLSTASLVGLVAKPVTSATFPFSTSVPKVASLANFTSVTDFGAVGDGVVDDSRAIQLAYDTLTRTGGTLVFPKGKYRVSLKLTSRNVHLIGEGRGATVLQAKDANSPILRALYREGSWDAVTISDMSLSGVGTNEGNGFVAGEDEYGRHDEYTGGTFFSRVQFTNFDKCISRPYGSIGLWIDGCQFGRANFHIWSKGSAQGPDRDIMHAGCVIVSRCHMDYFLKAMFYIDSREGDCGQVVFDYNIFEAGPGFVAYFRSLNSSGGVPGIVFRSNWNENTATAKNLVIEGRAHADARFLYAENVASAIRFEDTPLGTCELIGSALQTDNCNLQNLTMLKADAASTSIHTMARMFSGTSPAHVSTIAHPPNAKGLRTPWFRMPLPFMRASSQGGKVVMRYDAQQPITLLQDGPVKSVTQLAGNPFGDGNAQRISLASSPNTPFAQTATLKGSGWLLTTYIYKLLSESPVRITITGTKGISGEGEMVSREWEMLANISKFICDKEENVTVYHRSDNGSNLLAARVAMISFERLQDAVDFLNAKILPF